MKEHKVQQRRFTLDHGILAGCVLLGISLAVPAWAQDFRTAKGNNDRTGRAVIQPTTAALETTWNNAGRGFLRWWDPIFQDGSQMDNDGANAGILTGTWIDPSPTGLANPNLFLATPFESSGTEPPYRVAVTSTVGGNEGNPTAGATASYEWVVAGLIPGEPYSIEVSSPAGPTNINPAGPGIDLRFPTRYHLFEVVHALGVDTQWLDRNESIGGFSGLNPGVTYNADALGEIRIRLYNTVRRDSFGSLVDPLDRPGQDVVYADAVRAVSTAPSRAGSYQATPVVGQLVNNQPSGGAAVFNQRVVAARNESVFVGAVDRQMEIGVITSLAHNGAFVDAGNPLRRNMVFSYPARRPYNLTVAESSRYADELETWITSAPNANFPRHLVFRKADNLSGATTVGASFLPDNTFNSEGPNYLIAPANTVVGGFVHWRPAAAPNNYFIDVHLPTTDPAGTLATSATYQILRGTTVIQTITFNQDERITGGPIGGWVRLPGQPADGYVHDTANPLSVRLLDTGSTTDVAQNRQVYGDAVRFVGNADLSISSTPVIESVSIDPGTGPVQRDVVVMARENGSITVVDAHGAIGTGREQDVYWTWPSENPATDPNNALGEDGGIAETPTQFNLSSALVANVGGDDLLFIGADNGRVYCLEMTGRGDGTTRRRWTYPDDFDPTNATTPMAPTALGPIKGSIALATVAGNPTILIPASSGRIFAVDAAGNAATKTTNTVWQYPAAIDPPLGEIAMTPTVFGGQVFFGHVDAAAPAEGAITALDVNTGTLNWTREARADNVTQFGLFGSASPVVVPAPIVAVDSVYFVDAAGFITSLNAATGGVVWQQNSVPSGATAPLSFAYMRVTNPSGFGLAAAYPTVLTATTSGTLLGFYADGAINTSGNSINWGYFVESNKPQVSGIAVGGWPNVVSVNGNRTHLYAGDGDGYLYAFSSEDDTNSIAPITPGIPPGSQTADPSDPDAAELNSMITSDDVVLLTPSQYRDLQNKARSTTGLDYTDITNYKNTAAQRRRFEYGETLYLAVLNINDSTVASTRGYVVEVRVNSPGRNNRPLIVNQVYDVSSAPTPQQGGVAFIAFPMLPTGGNGLAVGNLQVTVAARSRQRGGAVGTAVRLDDTTTANGTPVGGGGEILADAVILNPFGLEFTTSFGTNQAGNVINNWTDPTILGNLPRGYVGVGSSWDKWVDGSSNPGTANGLPGTRLSTQAGLGEPVGHGGTGRGVMLVRDRSLMRLILGPNRGLSNVQMRAQDLAWQPVNVPVLNAADAGVYKPLPAAYSGFEDYPNASPNQSFDYPDLNRGGAEVAKSRFGRTENPLFGPVELNPPTYTQTDFDAYETTNYENGLTRVLQPTDFTFRWAVPRYQPAQLTFNGYTGYQTIYVESNNIQGFDNQDPGRQFALSLQVGIDERVTTDTKTLDLGSLPAGGGFNGGAGGAPIEPFAPGSNFRPWNAAFNSGNAPHFQRFTVFNDGNVNLLNVRLSRAFSELFGGVPTTFPLELRAPTQHQLAWLDGRTALFSDLDPALSFTLRGNVDPTTGAVALQKPRPGDPAPTRLSTNPRRRQNSFLNVIASNLLPTATFPGGDPFVGVAAPIGTPVGNYITQIYPFEDYGANADPLAPALGVGTPVGFAGFQQEPYADPGITLKFNLRESRLTNRPTTKAATNVDNNTQGDPGFDWANRQPAGMRRAGGGLVVAWSSNRRDVAGNANFAMKPRERVDANVPDTWRIYFANMPFDGTGFGQSPLADTYGFAPALADRWFGPGLVLPGAGGEWVNWFTLTAGETIAQPGNESSARFGQPAFPNSGFVHPLVDVNATGGVGRGNLNDRFVAFTGETQKRDAAGQVSTISQVFLAALTFDNNGAMVRRNVPGSFNGVVPLQDPQGRADTSSRKGRPALVQTDANTASVYYVGQNSGQGELFTSTFNGSTGQWTPLRGLDLGKQFQDLGDPSVILRRYRNENFFIFPGFGAATVADVFFTGKVKGRRNAEAFRGQLAVTLAGQPVTGDAWAAFLDRTDRLEYDAASGAFWAPGVNWRMADGDVANFRLLVLERNRTTGNFELAPLARNSGSAADNESRVIDREAREMVFETTRGGKVFVDCANGSVRFSGAVLPRNAQIFVVYTPRFIRVSGSNDTVRIDLSGGVGGNGAIARANSSSGANYRGVSAVFDERYAGIYLDPLGQTVRNRTEDLNYWFDLTGAPLGGNTTPRHDRFYVATNRTSGDGAGAARPYLTTMRFGVDLPAPVALNGNGQVVSLQVNVAPVPAGEPAYYQVDPVNGRVYFMSSMEGRTVQVSYTGVDSNGNSFGPINVQQTVGLVFESSETAVPIEQLGGETDIQLSLDPTLANRTDNSLRRPSWLWMFWSSTRSGVPDVYFQTMSPKTAPTIRRP